jgi:hypothetical protein
MKAAAPRRASSRRQWRFLVSAHGEHVTGRRILTASLDSVFEQVDFVIPAAKVFELQGHPWQHEYKVGAMGYVEYIYSCINRSNRSGESATLFI